MNMKRRRPNMSRDAYESGALLAPVKPPIISGTGGPVVLYMSRINGISFNEDCSCFTVATPRGFKVLNSDPVEPWVSRDFGPEGGLSHAMVLNRSNYLVLVGASSPQMPQTRVLVFNDHNKQTSVLNFDFPVLNALINRDVVVCVLETSVQIFSLAPPHELRLKLPTCANPMGLAALHNGMLVVPARQTGQIAIVQLVDSGAADGNKVENSRIDDSTLDSLATNSVPISDASESLSQSAPSPEDESSSNSEPFFSASSSTPAHFSSQVSSLLSSSAVSREDSPHSLSSVSLTMSAFFTPVVVAVVACHKSPLAAITTDGQFVATASTTGTLVKIYSIKTQTYRLFRRGLDKAKVYALALSPNAECLAVLSDKKTLHVFDLRVAPEISSEKAKEGGNERHALASVAPSTYFGDEWSFARLKTRSKSVGLLGWTANDSLIVVRPKESQWEKYVLVGQRLMAEAWRHIR